MRRWRVRARTRQTLHILGDPVRTLSEGLGLSIDLSLTHEASVADNVVLISIFLGLNDFVAE